MDRWQNRVAVVTGASSGIGALLLQDLLKAGLIVVGLARRPENIDGIRDALPAELKKNLYAVKADVGDLASVNEAFDWIEKNVGGIDVLINSAGVFMPGPLLTGDATQLQASLQTNVMGVVHTTQRAYKSMKERNFDGHVINMNSIVGHFIPSYPMELGTPPLNLYAPSKYAVTALTEIFRQEFRNSGTAIKVTSISPGAVDTPMVIEAMRQWSLKPKDVVAAIMYALSTPPDVQVQEVTIRPVNDPF